MLAYKNRPVILLISFALIGSCLSEMSTLRRGRRHLDDRDTSQSLETQYDLQSKIPDWDLLSQLVARPKRQWCRKGMTYNYVLGYCTISFSAMKSRGRNI